ncbi:MAG TPA: serine hydrolase domain-containing protein [Longimicrobiales bacterium]
MPHMLASLALLTAGITSVQSAHAGQQAVDAQQLGRFVDSVMHAEMKNAKIPGAAFVFVRDGRVVYMKGYGQADVTRGTTVDPERTVWRIGSITKTVTATAVMQLVDQGKLALTDTVNQRLRSMKIRESFAPPITVRHLLTHSAGFDEIRPGTQVTSQDAVLPLATFLEPMLRQYAPPGQFPVYTTYAPTVGGLLIEDVSRMSYASFLQKNLFGPLQMHRTNVGAPPDRFLADVAVGYELVGDTLQPQPWEWYHTEPASSVNSTAADMARYMLAHLGQGQLDGKRILSTSSALAMQRSALRAHPLVPAVTLGFWEEYVGALHVVEHGGNMAGFSAQLTLIPSENAGFFIVHHFERSNMRDNVRWAVLTHLYPAARERLPVPAPRDDFATRAAPYVGRYIPMTSCHTCQPPRANYVMDVKVDGDALSFGGNRWIESEPGLFVQHKGTGRIAFIRNQKGDVAYLFAGSFWAFEKVP